MEAQLSMIREKRAEILAGLQSDIMRLQGFKPSTNQAVDVGLGPLRSAFPNGSFPLGCVHEFLPARPEDSAATSGFIAGILSSLMGEDGSAVWISSSRILFPPALKSFGLKPERFIFLDLQKEKDVIWAMDEALKCAAITAVVGEVNEISFTSSRRLQLAVEQSLVTGFILRKKSNHPNTTACVSRWKVTSLPSETIDDLPGVGFPMWRAELMRIRNGKPGVWDLKWIHGQFSSVVTASISQQQTRKAG
jgi:protein ImuA